MNDKVIKFTIKINSETGEVVALRKELDKCKEDKKKFEEANKFLNEQIKEYNEKFAKGEKNEN